MIWRLLPPAFPIVVKGGLICQVVAMATGFVGLWGAFRWSYPQSLGLALWPAFGGRLEAEALADQIGHVEALGLGVGADLGHFLFGEPHRQGLITHRKKYSRISSDVH